MNLKCRPHSFGVHLKDHLDNSQFNIAKPSDSVKEMVRLRLPLQLHSTFPLSIMCTVVQSCSHSVWSCCPSRWTTGPSLLVLVQPQYFIAAQLPGLSWRQLIVSSWVFQGCVSPYHPRMCMPRHSTMREKTLGAVGAQVWLWKCEDGREKSWQYPGFVNSPHNPAGHGEWVLFLLHHYLAQTSFPWSPFLPPLHILYPPQKERQDSSRQVSPVPLDTSTLCVDQERNFR